MKHERIPFFAVLLIVLILFQVISALYGAIALFVSPGGELLQMPLSMLKGTPFNDYRIPSIILGILLGFFPGLAAIGLMFRPGWKWANFVNLYKDKHFGWTYSLFTGVMLNIWIITQVQMVGYGHIIQTIYGSLSIIILICSLMPSVMRYYNRKEEKTADKWRTL
ncbi:MAG: hypothetical protein IPH84_19525 [Bacteroidales bacterium]|nr:hypothetical protein [Bacteroidales bacterium]